MELVCTPCPCSKVEAIVQTPDPEMCNIEIIFGIRELLLKVCPKSGHDTSPLESVAQAWWWTSECADAFKQVKEALASSQVLAHYDPKLLIKMAADASSYEIGAVVSHVYPDGSERPIAFTSRTLSKSRKRSVVVGIWLFDIFINIYMKDVSRWWQITNRYGVHAKVFLH